MIGSKTALTVGSLATAMIFGGGLFLYMNFGSIAKRLAEHVATQTLGVDVDIASVSVSFQEKRVEVKDIEIANPSGYRNAKAMTIGSISIQAETLSQEMLNFSNAALRDMHVNLEITPRGTNLTDIRNGIKVPGREDKAAEDQKTITKVILRNFAAEGGTITPAFSMLDTQPRAFDVPPVHLKGIGERENGVLAGEAVAQIFKALTDNAINAAQEQGLLDNLGPEALKEIGIGRIDQVKDGIKNEVDGMKDRVKGLFQ